MTTPSKITSFNNCTNAFITQSNLINNKIDNTKVGQIYCHILNNNIVNDGLFAQNNDMLNTIDPNAITRFKSQDRMIKTQYTQTTVNLLITIFLLSIENFSPSDFNNLQTFKRLFWIHIEASITNFANSLNANNMLKSVAYTMRAQIATIKTIINDKYLKVQYTQLGLLKFNNGVVLDVSKIKKFQQTLVKSTDPIKAKNIRNILSRAELSDCKTKAVQYYESTITNKLQQTDVQKRWQIKNKIEIFNKILNGSMRNDNQGVSYQEAMNLAQNSGLFTDLKLDNEEDKIIFINHTIMINIHQFFNTSKMHNIKICIFRALKALAILTTAVFVICSMFTAATLAIGAAISAVVLTATIIIGIGATVDFVFGCLLFHELVFTTKRSINCGDGLESHTAEFLQLTQILAIKDLSLQNNGDMFEIPKSSNDASLNKYMDILVLSIEDNNQKRFIMDFYKHRYELLMDEQQNDGKLRLKYLNELYLIEEIKNQQIITGYKIPYALINIMNSSHHIRYEQTSSYEASIKQKTINELLNDVNKGQSDKINNLLNMLKLNINNEINIV